MKYVMIIIDGIGDDPIIELNGKTPLEKAFIPNMHYIATKGKIGTIDTAFEGFPVESMVCIMGLLGYDPNLYYPCGRAAFEALAQGININSNDLAFRCNIVRMDNQCEKIRDFTAGLISDLDSRRFLKNIKLPDSNWNIYQGQSYRNTLIIRDIDINAEDVICFPPHMHIDESIINLKPYIKKDSDNVVMKNLWSFLKYSFDKQDNKMLWVWSPSKSINLPSFKDITGLNGAVVCGLDFLKGIAMASNMTFADIPGATGYIDTDYNEKTKYAINYLKDNDFVLIHINATDEEAHQHNYNGKIKAIENIDNLIVGPILRELNYKYKNEFRIVICGDHKTRCSDGKHIGDPVPFAIYGSEIKNNYKTLDFNEKNCKKTNTIKSLSFLREYMIK